MGLGPSHVLKSVGSGIAVPGQAGGGECAAEQWILLFTIVSESFLFTWKLPEIQDRNQNELSYQSTNK